METAVGKLLCLTSVALVLTLLLIGNNCRGADQSLPYKQDFEKTDIGKVPPDFLVLDGAFTVKQDGGNNFLELPGAPLDSYAVQFGPPETENVAVSAAIFGTITGRRYPVFGVGLNGVSGYRLEVSPAKKALELYKDQALKATAPYNWKSGGWLVLRLQIINQGGGTWKIEGKVWPKGSNEPPAWMIGTEDKEPPQPGRASIFASPFSGTPIRFDDLKVEQALPTK